MSISFQQVPAEEAPAIPRTQLTSYSKVWLEFDEQRRKEEAKKRALVVAGGEAAGGAGAGGTGVDSIGLKNESRIPCSLSNEESQRRMQPLSAKEAGIGNISGSKKLSPNVSENKEESVLRTESSKKLIVVPNERQSSKDSTMLSKLTKKRVSTPEVPEAVQQNQSAEKDEETKPSGGGFFWSSLWGAENPESSQTGSAQRRGSKAGGSSGGAEDVETSAVEISYVEVNDERRDEVLVEEVEGMEEVLSESDDDVLDYVSAHSVGNLDDDLSYLSDLSSDSDSQAGSEDSEDEAVEIINPDQQRHAVWSLDLRCPWQAGHLNPDQPGTGGTTSIRSEDQSPNTTAFFNSPHNQTYLSSNQTPVLSPTALSPSMMGTVSPAMIRSMTAHLGSPNQIPHNAPSPYALPSNVVSSNNFQSPNAHSISKPDMMISSPTLVKAATPSMVSSSRDMQRTTSETVQLDEVALSPLPIGIGAPTGSNDDGTPGSVDRAVTVRKTSNTDTAVGDESQPRRNANVLLHPFSTSMRFCISLPWYLITVDKILTKRGRPALGIYFIFEVQAGFIKWYRAKRAEELIELTQLYSGEGDLPRRFNRMWRPQKSLRKKYTFPALASEFIRNSGLKTLVSMFKSSSSLLNEVATNFLSLNPEGDGNRGSIPMVSVMKSKKKITSIARKDFIKEHKGHHSAFGKTLKLIRNATDQFPKKFGIVGSLVYEGRISEELMWVRFASNPKDSFVKVYTPLIERPRVVIPMSEVSYIGVPDNFSTRVPLCGTFSLWQIATPYKRYIFAAPDEKSRNNWIGFFTKNHRSLMTTVVLNSPIKKDNNSSRPLGFKEWENQLKDSSLALRWHKSRESTQSNKARLVLNDNHIMGIPVAMPEVSDVTPMTAREGGLSPSPNVQGGGHLQKGGSSGSNASPKDGSTPKSNARPDARPASTPTSNSNSRARPGAKGNTTRADVNKCVIDSNRIGDSEASSGNASGTTNQDGKHKAISLQDGERKSDPTTLRDGEHKSDPNGEIFGLDGDEDPVDIDVGNLEDDIEIPRAPSGVERPAAILAELVKQKTLSKPGSDGSRTGFPAGSDPNRDKNKTEKNLVSTNEEHVFDSVTVGGTDLKKEDSKSQLKKGDSQRGGVGAPFQSVSEGSDRGANNQAVNVGHGANTVNNTANNGQTVGLREASATTTSLQTTQCSTQTVQVNQIEILKRVPLDQLTLSEQWYAHASADPIHFSGHLLDAALNLIGVKKKPKKRKSSRTGLDEVPVVGSVTGSQAMIKHLGSGGMKEQSSQPKIRLSKQSNQGVANLFDSGTSSAVCGTGTVSSNELHHPEIASGIGSVQLTRTMSPSANIFPTINNLENLNFAVEGLKAVSFVDHTAFNTLGNKGGRGSGLSRVPSQESLNSAAGNRSLTSKKWADVEKKAFWLNVYHTLLLHSFLLLGKPPDNSKALFRFQTRVSYIVGSHVFSLREIENQLFALNVRTNFLPLQKMRIKDNFLSSITGCGILCNIQSHDLSIMQPFLEIVPHKKEYALQDMLPEEEETTQSPVSVMNKRSLSPSKRQNVGFTKRKNQDPVSAMYGISDPDIRCRFSMCNYTQSALDEVCIFGGEKEEVEYKLNRLSRLFMYRFADEYATQSCAFAYKIMGQLGRTMRKMIFHGLRLIPFVKVNVETRTLFMLLPWCCRNFLRGRDANRESAESTRAKMLGSPLPDPVPLLALGTSNKNISVRVPAPFRRDRLLILTNYMSEEKAAECRFALEKNYRIRIKYSSVRLRLHQVIKRYEED